jgi:transcriptional regulator with XRE-family HTH domain
LRFKKNYAHFSLQEDNVALQFHYVYISYTDILGLSMKNEAERYKFVLEKSGLSKTAFAESIGISRSHNYHLERGTQKPPREVLERLATVYNINLNWLIHGRGQSGLEADTVEIELLDQEAAAGQGREIEDYIEKQYIPILYDFLRPHNPKNLKAVHVKGDSMIVEWITIELISANPAYETRRYSGNELEDIRVEGRVVACYHRL